jgi:hypothetical protein
LRFPARWKLAPRYSIFKEPSWVLVKESNPTIIIGKNLKMARKCEKLSKYLTLDSWGVGKDYKNLPRRPRRTPRKQEYVTTDYTDFHRLKLQVGKDKRRQLDAD